MSPIRRSAIALVLMPLAQCGVLPPFETVPPVLKEPGANPVTRVAVCYNSLTTTAEQVRAIASDACGAKETPRPLERDLTLAHCPILQPLRAVFACQPTP